MTRTRALAASLLAILACLAAAAPSASAAPKRFFGVVTQGGLQPGDYQLMQDAGVGTLRFQLGWPVVQSGEGDCQATAQVGVCDWRPYDELVGAAAAQGVQPFPYLLNVPKFIADDPNTPPVRSEQAKQAWSDFVDAAVQRYGPNGAYWNTVYPLEHPGAAAIPITDWQVWNEPSAQPFWSPKPKVREYAELVELTSEAITGADPDAYVVLAGLFGTPTVGIDLPKFLRSLYRVKGIERHFDALAIHPYGPDLDRVKFQVDWALDEMRRAGDRRADLRITEIGWASDRVHRQLGVGRKGQAKLLEKSFGLFERKRRKWNLTGVNWYAWQDTDEPGFCDFCLRSGLVSVGREPKLSYDAFREVTGGPRR